MTTIQVSSHYWGLTHWSLVNGVLSWHVQKIDEEYIFDTIFFVIEVKMSDKSLMKWPQAPKYFQ